MLFLLAMALIGDLILLPALLAGPLGKYFGKEKKGADPETETPQEDSPASLRLIGDDAPAATLPAPTTNPSDLKRLN